MKRLSIAISAVIGSLAMVVLSVAPANAVTREIRPAKCAYSSVVIASQTTGKTWHKAFLFKGGRHTLGSWNKGNKSNSGATTVTKRFVWSGVSTTAPKIASSGYRCHSSS